MASRDWAKSKVECTVCGGSHDGTPSGLRKHEATAKHVGAATALKIKDEAKVSPLRKVVDVAAQAAGEAFEQGASNEEAQAAAKAAVEATGIVTFAPGLVGDLQYLISQKQQALARRQRSLTWVGNHQSAEQEQAYAASKVEPLVREIDILSRALDEIQTERGE